MKTVLVTGGAGYIGSVLVSQLLERSYRVRVLDSLLFGGQSLVPFFNDKRFEFVRGDVRNAGDVQKATEGVDFVAHLASIVGDPACAKSPELAKSTNIGGSELLYHTAAKSGVKRFIFASTCSNYGRMSDPDSYVDEESTLAPVSLYAETKVGVERFLLSRPKASTCKPTCLRFSTVYGLSPRIRFDLTVNEFAKELALGRELVVFGEHFWRPYCHVVDLARSVVSTIESPESKVAFEVYNVGDTEENYRKQDIVNLLLKRLPDSKIKYVPKNEDPRDYRVSFSKIRRELDFQVSMRVPDGIDQLVDVVQNGIISEPDSDSYKNI